MTQSALHKTQYEQYKIILSPPPTPQGLRNTYKEESLILLLRASVWPQF